MKTSSNNIKKSNLLVRSSLSIALYCAIISPLMQVSHAAIQNPPTLNSTNILQKTSVNSPSKLKRAKIQLAILLDTSGSMDGLIDQTRNQLWQVVNEFSKSKKNGLTPILEVALFQYGNSTIPQTEGYIQKLSNFTRELDKISEGLFSLTTNGGDEYCGLAIKTAINSLQWSQNDSDIKTIFIAGNEPFTQGPINYQEALNLARQSGITVNTIFAGDFKVGMVTGWQSGALLAGGDYMSIDTDQRVVHIQAPQDQQIAELNAKLNQTYIPYGKEGKTKSARQEAQDLQSKNISTGLLAQRAKSKASRFYDNADWDLVDAIGNGKMEQAELEEMDEQLLPEAMQVMSPQERKDYVEVQSKARQEIQQKIAELGKSREAYVVEEKKKLAVAAPTMSDALTQSMRKLAEKKDFVFIEEKAEEVK